MNNDFTEEIKLIENSNLDEKLIVFLLYQKFCNYVLDITDENFGKHYVVLMKKSLKLAINAVDKLGASAEEFMKSYLQLLKANKLTYRPQVKGIIHHFENNLKIYNKNFQPIKALRPLSSLPFNLQIDLSMKFKTFIKDIFSSTINLYGEKRTQELKNELFSVLSNKLGEYISESLNQNVSFERINFNFQTVMVITTKEYLLQKVKLSEFNFQEIKEEEIKEFFASFSELEQKIWLINGIYAVASDNKSASEKIIEICKSLGISRLNYTKTTIFMLLRLIIIMGEYKSDIFVKNPSYEKRGNNLNQVNSSIFYSASTNMFNDDCLKFIEYIRKCTNTSHIYLLYLLRKNNKIIYGKLDRGKKIDEHIIKMKSNDDLRALYELLQEKIPCTFIKGYNQDFGKGWSLSPLDNEKVIIELDSNVYSDRNWLSEEAYKNPQRILKPKISL